MVSNQQLIENMIISILKSFLCHSCSFKQCRYDFSTSYFIFFFKLNRHNFSKSRWIRILICFCITKGLKNLTWWYYSFFYFYLAKNLRCKSSTLRFSCYIAHNIFRSYCLSRPTNSLSDNRWTFKTIIGRETWLLS